MFPWAKGRETFRHTIFPTRKRPQVPTKPPAPAISIDLIIIKSFYNVNLSI